jgi:hypothetical protein
LLCGLYIHTTEIHKRNLLLKWIGPEIYRLVLDHFDPIPALQRSYTDIVSFLQTFYKSTINYLAVRINFGHSHCNTLQTVSQFLNLLRSLAIPCKFGNTLEERLRDKFLLGSGSWQMQEDLFRNRPEDNTIL